MEGFHDIKYLTRAYISTHKTYKYKRTHWHESNNFPLSDKVNGRVTVSMNIKLRLVYEVATLTVCVRSSVRKSNSI